MEKITCEVCPVHRVFPSLLALHGISALEATLAMAPDTNAAGAETALDNPVCTRCSQVRASRGKYRRQSRPRHRTQI